MIILETDKQNHNFDGLANGPIHAKRKRMSTTGYSQSVSSPREPMKKKHRQGFHAPVIDTSKDFMNFATDKEGNLIGNFKAKVRNSRL